MCCVASAGLTSSPQPIPLSAGGRYCGGTVVLVAKTLAPAECNGQIYLKTKQVTHNLSWFTQSHTCAPPASEAHFTRSSAPLGSVSCKTVHAIIYCILYLCYRQFAEVFLVPHRVHFCILCYKHHSTYPLSISNAGILALMHRRRQIFEICVTLC